MQKSIVIVGAGASGLYAAKLLSERGYTITILEAAGKIGGRIHTCIDKLFDEPIELGAEFVHGNLPITLSLLNEAGIAYRRMVFNGVSFENGKLKKVGGFISNWHLFEEKLEQLNDDLTVDDFLNREFPGEDFNKLKQSVKQFASGFDTADTNEASMLSLKNEWLHEDEEQYRVEGGYISLLNFLENKLLQNGVQLMLNQQVESVEVKTGKVTVKTAKDNFSADTIIITTSLGVLKAGSVKLPPAASNHLEAIQKMGFGAIIKVLLKFKQPFWETVQKGIAKNAGFLFSSEQIPTWWTQLPERSSILTGWLGGTQAWELTAASDQEILKIAIKSLSAIFSNTETEIEDGLIAWNVANWTNNPFVLGSYSYPTVNNDQHIGILTEPVEGRIYFAGEALYKGQATGTVEAALASAANVVNKIYNS